MAVKEETRSSRSQPSTWVDSIVSDQKCPPEVIVLWGYAGRGGETNTIRLYWDTALSACWEVPKDAILHQENLDAPLSSAKAFWVARDKWSEISAFRTVSAETAQAYEKQQAAIEAFYASQNAQDEHTSTAA